MNSRNLEHGILGFPVGAFCPFSSRVPLSKPNSRKKGTLISKGLLGNQELGDFVSGVVAVYLRRTRIDPTFWPAFSGPGIKVWG